MIFATKPKQLLPLSDDTFEEFCFLNYDGCHTMNFMEFDEDLARIGYIKKLLTRYQNTGELKERLILNHIIVLGNVFRPENAVRILFFKIEKEQWCLLKPFLVYLGYLPKVVEGLKEPVFTDMVALDLGIVKILKALMKKEDKV